MAELANDTQNDTPATDRLVIRIKLVTEQEPEPPPPPPAMRLSKGVVWAMVGVVAVVLGWFSIGSLKSDLPPPAAPIAAIAPPPMPAKPIEPKVRQPPDAPTAAVNEVVPDVPQSALDTIRGTVKVVIRVTIDKRGSVVDTKADDRGPSRYFERLSREAAKKWTFTPATSEDQRTLPIRFNFTRDGATAQTLD